MSCRDPFDKKKSIDDYDGITQFDENKKEEKTMVFYGAEKTTEILLKTFSNAKYIWNAYVNSTGPSITMGVDAIRKGTIALYTKGVKIRYITEISKNNLYYCKELQKIATLRHMDGAKGGMALSESEYVATANLKESKPVSHLIYSNVQEIVEQEQSIFDSLWKTAIPSEIKIREIEEGIEPIETKVLDNKIDIYQKIELLSCNSDEILIAGEAGILQLIYDNLFDCYQKVLQKFEKGSHRGIRMITTISKDYSELVKLFMNLGIRIRHIQTPMPLNFVVTNRSFYTSIEKIGKEGKMMASMITSNDQIYIQHFKTIFEDLWKNGIDAQDIIKDIDRGLDPETIHVISRSSSAKDIYLKIIESAKMEIMLLFPTVTAFKRQEKIGIISTIEKAITDRNVKVKILLPKDKEIEETIQSIKENCKEHDVLVNVRYIEQMQDNKVTILIADRSVSLLMEVKDDLKQTFFEAIGLSTYSNSKAGVLSYISIFENLWKMTELLEELSSTNQKLQKQEKLQKEFVHIAAHELRNPIQPILALSQVLKNYTGKYYKEQDELLDIIIRNSKRLERLSEDILDITRIESNTLQLKNEKFNLDEFLQQAVMEYRQSLEKLPYAKGKKIATEIKFLTLYHNVMIIEWDKERLTQVIFNLLDNAYRFTKGDNYEGNGKIIVTCDKDTNGYAIIMVKDNGPGIDPEVLPKLFTKFVSKSKNGTGLGLFICKNIVESYGGRIWIETNKDDNNKNQQNNTTNYNKTNSDNKGAIIAFSIPLVDSDSLKEKSESNAYFSKSNLLAQNNNTGKKILIIDDESDLTITYRIGLELAGFIVDTYSDPLEALSRFIPNYYDLLLIDMRMPKMDGYELYDKIRIKDEKARACFITAYDMDSNTSKPRSLSFKEKENQCIIKKPVEIHKLIDIINEKTR